MERTRYSRRVKSPSYFVIEQQEELVKARSKARSPSRGRSPSRSKNPRPRSRSRTPSRSRKVTIPSTPKIGASTEPSPLVYSSDLEGKHASNTNSNVPSPASTPATNGAQKWKPNFQLFKPSMKIDKSAILAILVDLLKVHVAVTLVSAVFITTVFSYMLCNKNRCKLPTKNLDVAKLIQEISPLSAYIYLGFFTIECLFSFIPKRSNIIGTLLSISAVVAIHLYPAYSITSLLDRPLEFLYLALLTSLVLAGVSFFKGYRNSRTSTTDKLVYGYLFGFHNNGYLFGKKVEVIFHQIGFIQLAVTDVLFAISVYNMKFPIIFTTILILHFLFVLEKIVFANKKDYLPMNSGFFSNFFYLVHPAISSLAIYVAYKMALKEHTFYEYAGVAAASCIFGFYAYCKAKYDPPRRVAVRNVKGVKSRVGYMWNYLITSPWVGQAIIELSIAAAVIPYSYLSLISTVSFVALTKIVPLLY